MCGGKLEKEYEGENFIRYKCSEYGHYKVKLRKENDKRLEVE
jgi:hypothetical protein